MATYHRTALGLSQNQALENLKYVLSCPQFQDFPFSYVENPIRSDMLSISHLGGFKTDGSRYLLKDLSSLLPSLLDTISEKSSIESALIILDHPAGRLREFGFEERIIEEDLSLPLSFCIYRLALPLIHPDHCFDVTNLGLRDEDSLRNQGFNVKGAHKALRACYKLLNETLQGLPHSLSLAKF